VIFFNLPLSFFFSFLVERTLSELGEVGSPVEWSFESLT
jgi:hypothetical protein